MTSHIIDFQAVITALIHLLQSTVYNATPGAGGTLDGVTNNVPNYDSELHPAVSPKQGFTEALH